MTAQKGREFVLQINDGSSYQTVGGFRSNRFSINGQTIEVTNKGSDGARQLLADAGVVSLSTSGSGVFLNNDVHFKSVHDKALAQEHADCKIIVPGFMSYTGLFAISSLEMSGEHNGEVTYSISLESAGAIQAAVL